MPAKDFAFSVKISEDKVDELRTYTESLSPEEILFGLRFSYNRKIAKEGGYLSPGRKSLIKAETRGLTASQAQWRLQHWKAMIRTYREKGYSYPTISRIKKKVKKMATEAGGG